MTEVWCKMFLLQLCYISWICLLDAWQSKKWCFPKWWCKMVIYHGPKVTNITLNKSKLCVCCCLPHEGWSGINQHGKHRQAMTRIGKKVSNKTMVCAGSRGLFLGQIMIFHQPMIFPEIRGYPFFQLPSWGEVVFSVAIIWPDVCFPWTYRFFSL